MREPTWYVTLTVVVGLESSGTSSTCRPFGSRYSVMPSTTVTSVMPAGSAGLGWAAADPAASTASARVKSLKSFMRRRAERETREFRRWSAPSEGRRSLRDSGAGSAAGSAPEGAQAVQVEHANPPVLDPDHARRLQRAQRFI